MLWWVGRRKVTREAAARRRQRADLGDLGQRVRVREELEALEQFETVPAMVLRNGRRKCAGPARGTGGVGVLIVAEMAVLRSRP